MNILEECVWMSIWMYVIPEIPLIWVTGMHGLFVTIVVTTLVIFNTWVSPSLYITSENNDVIEPDAVLVLIYQSQYTLPLTNCLLVYICVVSLVATIMVRKRPWTIY